jgi:hypothetical protein
MICSTCQSEMADGTARIHGTFGTFLVFGLSHQPLWFKETGVNSGRELPLMQPNRDYQSWYCENCDILTVKNVDKS